MGSFMEAQGGSKAWRPTSPILKHRTQFLRHVVLAGTPPTTERAQKTLRIAPSKSKITGTSAPCDSRDPLTWPRSRQLVLANAAATGKRWTKIGAAFPHKEGLGFSIELKAFPIDGRLVVLPPDNNDDRSNK